MDLAYFKKLYIYERRASDDSTTDTKQTQERLRPTISACVTRTRTQMQLLRAISIKNFTKTMFLHPIYKKSYIFKYHAFLFVFFKLSCLPTNK